MTKKIAAALILLAAAGLGSAPRQFMDCILGTELENFYLCPCSPELSGIEAELYPAERRERRLVEAVEKAAALRPPLFFDQ